jgi:hypothetical protein
VWIASCCTVPSTGARRTCSRDFSEALTTSWTRPRQMALLVGELLLLLDQLGQVFEIDDL